MNLTSRLLLPLLNEVNDMPRPLRLRSETNIYHVMARGNRRRIIFHDKYDKQRFINIILNKNIEEYFKLFAYCIMDNHYHLLIREENEELSSIMKIINSSYATYYNIRYEGSGHVFQDRYRSEPVNNDEYLLGVTRYIHNNPKKAGIISRCEDYPWSSYQQYIYYKKDNELLDVSPILNMYSENRNKAVQKFIDFTESNNIDLFIDDYDEKDEEDRISHILDLESKKAQINIEELLNNRKYIPLRNEIIRSVTETSFLSISKIAQILGISRNIINKIIY